MSMTPERIADYTERMRLTDSVFERVEIVRAIEKEATRAALEKAATLIETTRETMTTDGDATIQHLTPRIVSDLTGMAWVKAIRDRIEQEHAPTKEHARTKSCPHCNGTGRMVRDPDIGTDQECFVCEGTGKIEQEGL